MKRALIHLSVGAAALAITAISLWEADAACPATEVRVKYGPWEWCKEKCYHFRKLEYRPDPKSKEFVHEYVVFFKNDPAKKNWVYFYNPKTEKFWARFPTVHHPVYGKDVRAGKELWSVLPVTLRSRELVSIDTKCFGPVGAECPAIPTSVDRTPLQNPPADLP